MTLAACPSNLEIIISYRKRNRNVLSLLFWVKNYFYCNLILYIFLSFVLLFTCLLYKGFRALEAWDSVEVSKNAAADEASSRMASEDIQCITTHDGTVLLS